jgi:hypothetical protein
MIRWSLLSLAVLFTLVLGARAQEPKETTPLSQLTQAKARIVQLESQIAKCSTDLAVAGARLALAGQPKADSDTKAAMQAIEQEAGCPLDWNAHPVTCRQLPKSK